MIYGICIIVLFLGLLMAFGPMITEAVLALTGSCTLVSEGTIVLCLLLIAIWFVMALSKTKKVTLWALAIGFTAISLLVVFTSPWLAKAAVSVGAFRTKNVLVLSKIARWGERIGIAALAAIGTSIWWGIKSDKTSHGQFERSESESNPNPNSGEGEEEG